MVGSGDSPKNGWLRFAELGPGWITALCAVVVALTSAGFLVGHVTAATGPPQPVRTVTVTVSAPTAPAAVGAEGNGVQLGAYPVEISYGYSVPLGVTKPEQAQFSTTGAGDLGTTVPGGHLVFIPLNGDRMVGLKAGSTPDYHTCSTETGFAQQADSVPGTAFCLLEPGRVAGVTVSAIQSSQVVLQVTVWRNIT